MAEDWDLFAVVKGCASATATTAATHDESRSEREEPLASLASLTFEDDAAYPFSFPNLTPLPTFPPNPTFPGVYRGSSNEPPPGPPPPTSCSFLRQSKIESTPKKPAEIQPQQPSVAAGRALSFRSFRSLGGSKSRKRKNHQNKTVCHLTADNLSADPWAWRKYGQKPIKSSPYPRNYYRCSSSKGCLAKKQVERSNLDPNIFIVTFTGDHIHPKPTHRNSLAGSTRNKLWTPQSQNPSVENNPAAAAAGSAVEADASYSSPSSSTSPSHPLSGPAEKNGEEEMVDRKGDILIPNTIIDDDDDLFNGLPELSGNNGMGQSLPFSNYFLGG